MKICNILVIVGILLLLDSIFGILRLIKIPLNPKIGGIIGFILIVFGIYLNSVGKC